jgi:hypothetical protein
MLIFSYVGEMYNILSRLLSIHIHILYMIYAAILGFWLLQPTFHAAYKGT